MVPAHVLEAFLSLLVIPIVGRVVLSVLPPGRPGHHDLASLPATWAASFLLGAIALSAEGAALDRLGFRYGDWEMLIPWALLAVGRWITLPGATEPRHEVRSEAPSPASRLLALVALGIGAWAALRADGPLLEARALPAASIVAVLLACGEGLASARRAPLARALAILGLALMLLVAPPGQRHVPLLAIGCGAAFAIPWLRRGDRRACALSVISFSAAALSGAAGAGLGAAGLLGLCLHTPGPARRAVAAWSVPALLACAALGRDGHWPIRPRAIPWIEVLDLVAIGATLLLVVGWTLRRPATAASSRGAIAEPRREIAALRDALLAGILFALGFDRLAPASVERVDGLALLPLSVLALALVLAPAEEPLEGTPGAA